MEETIFKSTLRRTREYLDYLEEHYDNVQKAWVVIQERCKKEKFIWDDFIWAQLDAEIKAHDVSKFSSEELVPYREKFFPVRGELFAEGAFESAWEHHKILNGHHWETWTKAHYAPIYSDMIWCVHMLADWIGMSYKFGDTAGEFYQKKKEEMTFPNWAEGFILRVLEAVEGDKQ